MIKFNLVVFGLVAIMSPLSLSGCAESTNAEQNMYSAPMNARDNRGLQADRAPTAKTLYAMANVLAAQGNDLKCEAVFRRIIRDHSDFFPVYNSLAELLMRQGRTNEAMETINRGLGIRPRDPVLLNNLGMCWVIHRDYENAMVMFTKSAGIMPENARYRANMAMTMALMGRYDESLSLYKQVLPEDKANHNVSILQKARENTKAALARQSDIVDSVQSDTLETVDMETWEAVDQLPLK
jgi:serine/threonine-protein kinase